ncbi:hypothetical protein [Desulfosporosinus lacus]|uniref:Phage integrase family protein n=1 Tax=Desulfosporosinus lacus DSM 15449 TaxID=1121420 RepID=A0A1M5QR70_9FIRM|nr:hypothetical protein [Desulfosporosinus lacus]SHH16562.1 hypothetical protein SAMN02746098_00340 [Desulfosporosinus lacus DSM 15449]
MVEQIILAINETDWYSKNVAQTLFNLSEGTGHAPSEMKYIELNMQIAPSVNFANNFWDFSGSVKRKLYDTSFYKFNFKDIRSTGLRFLAKRYVLRSLFDDRNSYSSVESGFLTVKKFIKFLESHHIQSPGAITSRLLEIHWSERKKYLKEAGKVRVLKDLRKFLTEVDNVEHTWSENEFEEVLSDYNRSLIKYQIENDKTPNIPNDLFDRIISCAIKDLDDEELDVAQRMTAGKVVLFSQIGMRQGEGKKMETNKLSSESIFNGAQTAYVMEFWTYKTTRSKDGRWAQTRMTPQAVKAYEKLDELGRSIREKTGSSLLFPSARGKEFSSSGYQCPFMTFFYRHQEDLKFDTLSHYELENQVKKTTVKKAHINSSRYIPDDESDNEFYYINFHQFRVAVVNKLKDKVSLQWIKIHMNHLEEEMTKHYFRDDKKTIIEETFKFRASSNGLLETNPDNVDSAEIKKELNDPFFKENYEAINNFLRRKKLSIHNDLKEIVKVLSTPVRDMELGYCLNALGRVCERQERLTLQEKWYSARVKIPNIVNLPFTYKRFVEKMVLVEHNEKVTAKNQLYQRSYELERASLEKLCINSLYPELELLMKEIDLNGVELIVKNYPKLEDIINSFTRIETECLKWMPKAPIA